MTDYLFPKLTAAAYREKASGHYQAAEDSFERSDTDGFLSQWASGVVARENEYLADLAEAGGKWEVTVLADLEGNEVNARPFLNKFKKVCWIIFDETGEVKEFAPYKPAKEITLSKRGYKEVGKVLPCCVKVYSGSSYSVSYIYWPIKWVKPASEWSAE